MRIPFTAIRSHGSQSWKAQFERTIQVTNSTQVWAHFPGQVNAQDPAFAGTLSGIALRSKAHNVSNTGPLLQIYGLGQATTLRNGGSTSQIGTDLAVPVTATSSLLASFHPDYSNVQTDQQTIAPSVGPHFYNEVRPFFTQIAHHFNYMFGCTSCPITLYTPAIPNFRRSYAYEATQGNLDFAAFDAVGSSRTDDAEALSYIRNNSAAMAQVSFQRVGVHSPGLDDTTASLFTGYEWQRSHAFVYLNGATDQGITVTDPGLADYLEFGVGHADKNTTYGLSYQKVGPEFFPADGFVYPDVAGLIAYFNRALYFGQKNALQDFHYNLAFDDQNNHLGAPASKLTSGSLVFDFAHELSLRVYGGYEKNEAIDGEYLPFNENGVSLGYRTQSSTPSSVSYTAGAFYHGALGSWSYLTTAPVTRKVNLALELDESTYTPEGSYIGLEPKVRQWLERASIDWRFNRYAAFDIGFRKISGRNLPNAFQTPDLPVTNAPCGTVNGIAPFDCVGAGNTSAAFHVLSGQNEWYAEYGNPNSVSTAPAFYIKWVRNIGDQKGM